MASSSRASGSIDPDVLPDHRPFDPATIFNVDGLVAVVTGGGTGQYGNKAPKPSFATSSVVDLRA